MERIGRGPAHRRRLYTRGGRAAGFSLGFTLLLTSLLLVTVLTMAAVATTTLNMSRNRARGMEATYLAEAAAMRALAKIHQGTTFGTKETDQVYVRPDNNDDTRWGAVTFATTAEIPYSTNNLDGSRSTGYGGAAVPAGSVRLVATGASAGERRQVEVYARVPRFPYVLTVGGDFSSSGSLEVRAANTMADFASQQLGEGSQGGPASMAATESVTLGGVSTVSGDIVCSGTVKIAEGSTVGGMVRPGEIDLPGMDPTKWEPSGSGVEDLDPVYDDPDVKFENKQYRSDGSVEFAGNVVLDNTLLYVKGDLTINGSVAGRGALLVEGHATIKQGADLAADNLVALVTKGDVSLTGDSGQKSYFQGLVYAGGRFEAARITVAGAFLSGGGLTLTGSPSSSGDMSLQDVSATYVPEATDLTLTFSKEPPPRVMAPSLNQMESPRDKDVFDDPLYDSEKDENVVGAATDGGITLKGNPYYADSAQDGFNAGIEATTLDSFGPNMVDAVLKDQAVDAGEDGHKRVHPEGEPYYLKMWEAPSGSRVVEINRVFLPVDAEDSSKGELVVQTSSLKYNPETGRYEMVDAETTYKVAKGMGADVQVSKAEEIAETAGTTLDEMVTYSQDRQRAAYEMANKVLDGSVPMGVVGTVVNLDLNQFLSDATPVRVTSWRDW